MVIEPYYTQRERHAICRETKRWPEVLVEHKTIDQESGDMILHLSCGHKSPRKNHRAINAADQPGATSRVICEACAKGLPATR